MAKKKFQCTECDTNTTRKHPILAIPLCRKCETKIPDKYQYITKTRAMSEYRLKPIDLDKLGVFELPNPHYRTAAPMQLYLLRQIEGLAKDKWGSPEPYIVTLTNFSNEILAWFLEDTNRLKQLPPEKFEYFVADRLDQMGLGVHMTGNTNTRDGGVDIVAYPDTGCLFPFIVAVQVKHHRKNVPTKDRPVKDLLSVVTSQSSPFNIGLIVTNTAFTANAHWWADNNKKFLRLRDLGDLQRWLKNDFVNEYEWREIPDEIELTKGISITIPKPKILKLGE